MARKALSMPSALCLALVVASQATAATWCPAVQLTKSGDVGDAALVTVGLTTAITAYTDRGIVVVRRSRDSGFTWSAPLQIARGASSPGIAGRGSKVDVVWVGGRGTLRYARSTDAAKSFEAARTLARPADGYVIFGPRVARGPNGVVAVVWRTADHEGSVGAVRVKVSTDGGVSFGDARTLVTAHDITFYYFRAEVAVGDGVVYVAYSGDRGLQVRRSLDAGRTWSGAVTISTEGESPSITAEGTVAFLAYAAGETVGYRKTTTRGRTWSPVGRLSSVTANAAGSPSINVRNGVVRAAFQRCLVEGPGCASAGVFYLESRDGGTTWTAAQRIAIGGWPVDVGFAGRRVVMYVLVSYPEGQTAHDVYVRTASR